MPRALLVENKGRAGWEINDRAVFSLDHHPTRSARLAQSVERETLNLKVVGSTPTSGSIPVGRTPLLLPFLRSDVVCSVSP